MSRGNFGPYTENVGLRGRCNGCGEPGARFYPQTTQRHNAPGVYFCDTCADRERKKAKDDRAAGRMVLYNLPDPYPEKENP